MTRIERTAEDLDAIANHMTMVVAGLREISSEMRGSGIETIDPHLETLLKLIDQSDVAIVKARAIYRQKRQKMERERRKTAEKTPSRKKKR